MKRIALLLSLIFLTCAVFAQVKTNSNLLLSKSSTYYKYTGVASDTLTANQDTIQVPFVLNKDYPVQYYANIVLDTIAGADTTVVVNVYGKVFPSESWSLVSTQTTSAVTASDAATAVYSTSEPAYVFNADSTITTSTVIAKYYRYLMFELIVSGDDSVGEGIKLDNIELKLWERKY